MAPKRFCVTEPSTHVPSALNSYDGPASGFLDGRGGHCLLAAGRCRSHLDMQCKFEGAAVSGDFPNNASTLGRAPMILHCSRAERPHSLPLHIFPLSKCTRSCNSHSCQGCWTFVAATCGCFWPVPWILRGAHSSRGRTLVLAPVCVRPSSSQQSSLLDHRGRNA